MPQLIIFVLILSNICYLSGAKTIKEPTKMTDTNTTELQRLVEDHRSYCRIADSCNSTHWDFDSYCYCDRCSCEPECVETDKCCPEVIKDLWDIPKPKAQQQCISLSYRGFQSEFSYTMIANCPVSFKHVNGNADLVNKCEKRYESDFLGDIIPVDDETTDFIYANKHCAECHSVPSINLKQQWLVEVKCNESIFTPRSVNTILSDINTTNDCDLVLRPIIFNRKKTCEKVISSCNETGLWKTYDSFIEQACNSYKAPYMKKYRNPFCAVCNENDVEKHKRSASNCGIRIPGSVPFSALLEFRPDKIERETNFDERCRQDQIYDSVSNVCRDLLCEFGKILNNGSCESVYSRSSGLCYQIYVKVTPIGNNSVDTDKNGTKFPDFSLQDAASAFESDLLIFARKYNTHGKLRNVSFYEIKNPDVPVVDTANSMVASVFFYVSYFIDDGEFLNGVNERYNDNNISLSIKTDSNAGREIFKVDLIRLRRSNEDGILSPLSGKPVFPFLSKIINTHLKVACAAQKTFIVTKFSFHPFVRLDNTSYAWDVNSSGVIIHELNVFTENEMFRETEDGSAIFVSFEVFKAALKDSERSQAIPVSEIEGLVSLIAMSISVCCLLITLFTYSLFHVLRSQPGINNMILCLCLIFGYLTFILGSTQTHLGQGCKILGGAIHFSWIFTFFWMNVCSFHMYQVFGSLDQPKQSTKSVSLTAFYLLYSTLSSVCLIGINIGITHYITGGKSFGYGPEKTGICYIFEPMMTLYTMALPAICIIIVNIVMFSVVVIRVRRVSVVQKHVRNDENYFSIYMKLSTITGMAWIAAVPMMLLQSVIFNYIFIALTCTQGIYLMIAFTCNRRVFKLYSGEYDLKKVSSSTVYGVSRSKSSSSMSKSVTVKFSVTSNHI